MEMGWGATVILLALGALLLLFLFPGILHQRKDFPLSRRVLKARSVVTFSHRGGQKECFENSMGAFRNSIRLGVFGLELDVHKTRCGKLVVAHDHSLLRLTGQDALIRDVCYEDIGEYLPRIRDAWIDEVDDFGHLPRERPPLLEELLRVAEKEDLMLSIDLKSNDPGDFETLCRLVSRHLLQEKVVVGGFSSSECRQRMRQLGLSLPMFFDVRQCLLFFLATLFGLLPLVPFRCDWLMIPHGFRNFYRSQIYKRHFLAKLAGAIFWVEKWWFRLVAWHMNRRGIPVVFWVLNCREDWELGLRMGANGLMTDFPSRLKEFLQERGLFGRVPA